MAKCKSCGAEIFWARTEKEKLIPLDVKPEKRFVFTNDEQYVYNLNTYISHFATCPDAARHRKAKP